MTDIKGYTTPSQEQINAVNVNKELEERVLRQLESLDGLVVPLDLRMRALAVTKVQEAFMWANRAIMQPGRVTLPEDD